MDSSYYRDINLSVMSICYACWVLWVFLVGPEKSTTRHELCQLVAMLVIASSKAKARRAMSVLLYPNIVSLKVYREMGRGLDRVDKYTGWVMPYTHTACRGRNAGYPTGLLGWMLLASEAIYLTCHPHSTTLLGTFEPAVEFDFPGGTADKQRSQPAWSRCSKSQFGGSAPLGIMGGGNRG